MGIFAWTKRKFDDVDMETFFRDKSCENISESCRGATLSAHPENLRMSNHCRVILVSKLSAHSMIIIAWRAIHWSALFELWVSWDSSLPEKFINPWWSRPKLTATPCTRRALPGRCQSMSNICLQNCPCHECLVITNIDMSIFGQGPGPVGRGKKKWPTT